jgi:phosphopantothenoylcysteine decarboxylase/phosphopantothenate--cysteine ligase
MLEALQTSLEGADILVMAAAVADYAPEGMAGSKLRRRNEALDLHLQPNVDILKTLGPRPGLFRVGFAAETEELRANAQKKLADKHLDLIVANQVGVDGQGLGSDYNAATVIAPSGVLAEIPRMPKWDVAARIWDAIDASRNHGG